jgi:hypothetical protein
MVAPLIILAWILLLWLVVALCRAARLGDRQGHAPEREHAIGESGGAIVSRPHAARSGRSAHSGSAFVGAGRAPG